ncbi:nuclear transport factor 2 family protein [Flexibacterium corallicola]|uniref:nuclear transport factor 2 family protein n=1 Tax=Flexibacterium corallicola TaxID=3037259 RepID=UPI00286EFEBB|nr:nuclear transport factor 2 family protein [Pseudovibrio sp. M1P-2-3]
MDTHGSIVNSISTFFQEVDASNWAAVQTMLGKSVEVEHSNGEPGEIEYLSPSQIIEPWQAYLAGFDNTHHQIGTLRVDTKEQKAKASLYCTITHFLKEAKGGNVWRIYGAFDLALSNAGGAWVIDQMKFHNKFQEGNTELPSLAKDRLKVEEGSNHSPSHAL